MHTVAINQILILLLQCFIVALLILFLFRLRSVFGLGLLFTALGVFQFLQVFLSSTFFIEIAPGILVSPGTAVFFTGSLFAILLIYIREDALEARKVIYALVIANLVLSLVQLMLGWGIESDNIINNYNLPKAFYIDQARMVFAGSLVLFIDAFLIIFLYEFISRYVSFLFLRVFITMVLILSFDSVLFSLGVFGFSAQFLDSLISGILSKTSAAIVYSSLFTIYLLFMDKKAVKMEMAANSYQDIFYSLTYRQKFEKIYEEKEVQKIELQKSEDKFQTLLRSTPLPICYVNKEGIITFRNDRFIKVFGYTVDEVPSLTEWWQKAYPDEQYRKCVLENWESAVKKASKKGTDIESEEYKVKCNDGSVRDVIISGITINEDFLATFVDITDRKQSEEEVKNQATKWQATFDAISDSVSIIDMDGRILQYNKASLSLFNVNKEDIAEKYCYQVVHGTVEHFTDCPLVRMKKSKQFESMVYQEKDRWLEVTVDPIYDEQKKLIGAVHVVSDITERKQAEEALKEAEYRSRILFDHAPIPIWEEDFSAVQKEFIILKKRGITDFNKYFDENPKEIERLTVLVKIIAVNEKSNEFYSVADISQLRTKLADWFTEGSWEVFKNELVALANGLTKFESEIKVSTPEGNDKHLFFSLNVPPASVETLNKVIVSFLDITDLKLAEEKLTKYAERLEILHKMDKSILTAESPKKLAMVVLNDLEKFVPYKFAAINKYDKENNCFKRVVAFPLQQSNNDISDSVFIFSMEAINIELLTKGKVQIIKDLRKEKTISKRVQELIDDGIYSAVLIPLISEGVLMGTMNLANDSMDEFTDDKIEIATEIANQLAVSIRQWRLKEEILQYTEELEERVLERTAQLEHSNQELREFAQIVSHDLKAPLRAISQLSYWVSQDYADKIDEEGQKKLKMLAGRVKRLDNLIEGILLYSRAGKQREKETPIDLHHLLEETISLIDPPSNIKIIIENQLPKYIGDSTRLGQLFQNLIDNAIKFMDKPKGIIKIGCKQDSEYWQFYISDNGPGIEEKYFDRIFQIFQRLVSRDVQEGAGIGLSLAKRIVQIYGGEIWLESKLGEGTNFYFTLPYKNIEA